VRNAFSILVGKPEGKRSLGRPRRRWEYIRIDVKEVEWEGVVWMYVAQVRAKWLALVDTVIKFRLP